MQGVNFHAIKRVLRGRHALDTLSLAFTDVPDYQLLIIPTVRHCWAAMHHTADSPLDDICNAFSAQVLPGMLEPRLREKLCVVAQCDVNLITTITVNLCCVCDTLQCHTQPSWLFSVSVLGYNLINMTILFVMGRLDTSEL